MLRTAAALLTLLFVVAVVPAAEASNRYDPRLRFRTLSTPRFDIHFHQGVDDLARRLAGIVEEVATDLEPRLGRPRARVHVILVNQTDISNGWATPFPYNLIELVAATPRAESTIGNTSDWLRLVFTHEYTHVIHLERSRGLLGAVGRVFGRHPFFYPNLFLPPWQIEGLATHVESAGGEGRAHAGDFRMVMTRAAEARRFPSLDRASNDIVQWPGGQTPYLYGVFFHEYLARTYGEDSLRKLADSTASKLPYFGALAFRDVYGKPLGTLWQEFEREAARGSSPTTSVARPLTMHGFNVRTPWFAPDGPLFYSRSDPHGFPALMQMTSNGPRQVATRVGGEQLSAAAGMVVFDQVEYVRSVALQSDIYALSVPAGGVHRLTREARAGDPDVTVDGRRIVCTVQTAEGRALATFDVPQTGALAVPRVILAEPGTDYGSPRWSPDGQTIVAERRTVGGASEIVLVDPSRGALRQVIASTSGARNASPIWSRNGRTVFFVSDREGGSFQLFAADVARGTLRKLEGAGASVQSPTLSPDGTTIVFVGYTPAGYDLFSLFAIVLDNARWKETPSDAAASAGPRATAATVSPTPIGEAYSPGKTIWPRYWSPVIEEDGEDVAIGATTSGVDALGRHGYVASAAWSTRTRPDWFVAYAYDRWRPTFFADVSDDEEPFADGRLRAVEVNAGALVAFRRIRRVQSVIGAFHAARETGALTDPETGGPRPIDADRRALRGAWIFNAARDFGFSISREEGVSLGISGEWTSAALGSDGSAGAVVVDARGYQRLGSRHSVLAVRAAAASAWGDETVRRVFAAGSSSPAPSPGLDFGGDAIALIRGFETRDVFGDHAAVVNVDYRFPIKWIERGVGTWPLFLRNLHGAVFVDAGAAWNTTLRRSDRRASAGFEFSSDIVAGYSLPLTATVGVAFRDDPTRRSRGAAVFGRVGRAF